MTDWIGARLQHVDAPELAPEPEPEPDEPQSGELQPPLVELLTDIRDALLTGAGDQRNLVFPRGTAAVDRYGTQNGQQTFAAGDAGSRPILESQHRAELLWAITANGDNVQFELLWGTNSNLRLANLRSPLSVCVPGNVALNVSQINPALGATANATVTIAGSRGQTECRQLITALGALSPFTRRVTALAASTVTVGGTAVVLAAGASVDVCNPAVLTVGGPVLADLSI